MGNLTRRVEKPLLADRRLQRLLGLEKRLLDCGRSFSFLRTKAHLNILVLSLAPLSRINFRSFTPNRTSL